MEIGPGHERDQAELVARTGWTRENVWHALSMLRHARNPAATVYDSIGSDFASRSRRGG